MVAGGAGLATNRITRMTRTSPFPRFGFAVSMATLLATLAASLAIVVALAEPAGARTSTEATMANEIAAAINAERAARGIPALSRISDTHAQSAAEEMRRVGHIQHSFDLGVYPHGVKENIGFSASGAGAASGRVPYLWMGSSGHRAAMLSLDSDKIAVGVACINGNVYVAAHMVASSQSVAQRPSPSSTPSSPVVTSRSSGTRCRAPDAAPSAGTDTVGSVRGRAVMMRNLNSAGATSATVTLPRTPDQVFSGDWNGDGIDTVGYRKGAKFYLLSRNVTGAAVTKFTYGRPGDLVVIGDWNGDGIDTVGVRRNNVFYLRNRNTTGVADIVLAYGKKSDTPVVGDWNGDGIDTIGVRRNNVFYLRNRNTTGVAHIVLAYGVPSDVPVVGDWNGDGIDTFGVRRGSLYYLRNANTTGRAHIVFSYGRSSDLPISGDWNGK